MLMKKKQNAVLFAVLSILFMAVMFAFSNQPYKEQDMRPELEKLIHLNAGSLPKVEFYYGGALVTSTLPYDFIEFWIRKACHVMEYMVLTLLVLFTLRMASVPTRYAVPAGFLASFIYANLDEWHQTFISGRTGHFIDVVTFDSFGILAGICLFVGIARARGTK
ncbi:hypothetical protein BpJC7_00160 [Weizmannia acidilactici]|mgnify:CR=1 FL=1|uniref:VanZ-like domain-containing protein n=2 Tax=Weizmannia acidilactici TaxID=2607726 RepID=A0A5J4JA40_9BACI|nr:hypothetical protein BpJC4_19570 [Weizmannia acidilactici]GER68713.1 hypothetical protein BpJC7_00160 [Weizmannia acidilactici]GER74241.1 hypothetical protein BpPP18_23080 [Weizmannia acidilactici]